MSDEPVDDREILAIIGEELSSSSGGNENDFIDANRQKALATYLGQPIGNEEEGRSSIVSTDVADAIEWIMPEIMKSFTQNNQIVTFDPTGPEDQRQAEIESQFVYDVLMKDNNGFLVLHQFIKDALLQKNGFIKCFYSDEPEAVTETYTGLNELELQAVTSQEGVEVVAASEEQTEMGVFYDVKVRVIKEVGKINVISVPPEEFRINRMHNEMDVSTARFTAHVMLKTAGELINMGYDRELVDSLPSFEVYEDDRDYRFYMQDETVEPNRDVGADASLRTIEISECYMYMDVDGDGIPELVKATVAGGDNPSHLLDIEEIDHIPFVSTTAILMSHKLFGLSIYDRLKQVQEQKTTLWRNIFDNMYLQNNQRNIVVEGMVNLDDVLVSRPGGIIRAKRADAIVPYQTPPISSDAYQMMGYLDQVRASRTGVSPEQGVQDQAIGESIGSEGLDRMMNQKEELVGLMIRVIAETGIKPLCEMVRNLSIKHQNVSLDYKFRGDWVKVNPAMWDDRKHTSVRVGTGTGNRKQQQQTLTAIMQMQKEAMQMPSQAMVDDAKIFSAIDDFSRLGGLAGAETYFYDPNSQEGQQKKQQAQQAAQQAQQAEQQQQMAMMESQAKIAEAEVQKAQAQMMNVELKAQIDFTKNQLQLQKQMSDAEIQHLEQQLEQAKALVNSSNQDEELAHKYYAVNERTKVELERIDSQERIATDRVEKAETSE